MDLVDAAASIVLEGTEFADEWTTIRNRINRKAKTRNKIAHMLPFAIAEDQGRQFLGVYHSTVHPEYKSSVDDAFRKGIADKDIETFIEGVEETALQQTKLTIKVREVAEDHWYNGGGRLSKHQPLTGGKVRLKRSL